MKRPQQVDISSDRIWVSMFNNSLDVHAIVLEFSYS